jgi:hypothetical protein
LSPRALEIANAIGADELASRIQTLDYEAARGSEGARLRLLELRQQLSERILLALLEVKSAAAEADCEEERADGLADRLQEMQEERVKRLTIFSLLGSGLGGILSGGLAWAAQGTAAAIAGIAAGMTEAGFGAMALFEDIEHDFRHDRNLLTEVWEAPKNPGLIPVSVWRFLNRPLRDDPKRRSLRETLIARWREDGRLGEAGSETERHRIALLFGNGGSYTITELRDRAAMFDMLESDINLMSHDLEEFLREISAPGGI